MDSSLSFAFAAGFGIWTGGWINAFSQRYAGIGVDVSSRSLPVRILTALCFGAMVLQIDFSTEWLIAVPFVGAMITITLCDLKGMVIPDIVTIPAIALTLLLRLWVHPLPYWDYIAAGMILGGVFYLLALLMQVLGKTDAVGGGDIKLLVLTGLVLGLKLSFLCFLIFCFAGTVLGIVLVVSRRYRANLVIPFAPIISISAILSYFWGIDFVQWMFDSMLLR